MRAFFNWDRVLNAMGACTGAWERVRVAIGAPMGGVLGTFVVVLLAPLEMAHPGPLLVPPLELAGAVAAAIVLFAPLEIGAAVVAFVCTVLVRVCMAVMAGVLLNYA